jgi:hypothetical protein
VGPGTGLDGDKDLMSLSGIEPRFLSVSARNLVTIPTELSRLPILVIVVVVMTVTMKEQTDQ